MTEDSPPPFIVFRTPAPRPASRTPYERALELRRTGARHRRGRDEPVLSEGPAGSRRRRARLRGLGRLAHSNQKWKTYRAARQHASDVATVIDILTHQNAAPAADLEKAGVLVRELLADLDSARARLVECRPFTKFSSRIAGSSEGISCMIKSEPIGRRSMQFAVTFRHMEPTDALKAYAKERMERVRKYLPIRSPVTSSSPPNVTITASTSASSSTTGCRSPVTRRPRTCTARSISASRRSSARSASTKASSRACARGRIMSSRCRGRTRSSTRRFTS